jgi:ankyrin repeat protein
MLSFPNLNHPMKHRLSSALLVMLCGASSLPTCQAGKIHDAVAKRDLAALERVLEKEPKQVNARCYPDFDTPLHMAVAVGDPVMVKLLLDAGADPGMRQPGHPGYTPVQRAVYLGDDLPDRELLQRAIEDCLDSFNKPKPATEPPTAAIKRARDIIQRISDSLAAVSDKDKAARLEVLTLLLAQKPDLCHNFNGSLPPIHLAAITGNLEVMRMLRKSGADVNGRDDNQWVSPLAMAVMSLPRQEVISALIDAGADIDSTDRSGLTPLMAAALGGSLIAVDILISRDASLDAEDLKGRCVLTCAAEGGNDEIVKRIYQKSGRDLARFASKDRLFKAAAIHGSMALAEILLANGVDINIRDHLGYTPLLTACEKGHQDLVRFLLDKGADPDAKLKDGSGLFERACHGGCLELAGKLLIEGQATARRPTLLHELAMSENVAGVEFLIAHGADVNQAVDLGVKGVTPLMAALTNKDRQGRWPGKVLENDCARIVELLLEHGAKVEALNGSGANALDLAADHCGARVIEALLKAGGKPDAPCSINQITPVQNAAGAGRAEAVQAMLGAGTNSKAVTGYGETLVHLAAAQGNGEVLQLLIEKGLSVNEKERSYGATPLHFATMANSLECVRLLLAAGVRPDTPDSGGIPPLLWAINREGRMDILKSKPTDNGAKLQTMAANLLDRLRIIHLLIESGAKTDIFFPDAKESEPRTLIEFARKNGSPEIVELLENPPPVARKPGKR